MSMSPLLIKMALFYYSRPTGMPYLEGAVSGGCPDCQFHKQLAATELIYWSEEDGTWIGNMEPLSVYAEALMSVPVPVKTWAIPKEAA